MIRHGDVSQVLTRLQTYYIKAAKWTHGCLEGVPLLRYFKEVKIKTPMENLRGLNGNIYF